MRDERYVGNVRGMFTPDNDSVVIGDHVVAYHPGADPIGEADLNQTPYVSVFLDGTQVLVYRDFNDPTKVVVDVTGDPDRVLWNDATFNYDTNYVDEDTTRIKYI